MSQNRIIFSFIATTLLLADVLMAQEAPNISGHWQITAKVIEVDVPNSKAEKGSTFRQNWVIQQNGNRATITSPKGVIHGVFLPQTHEFPGGAWNFVRRVYPFLGSLETAAEFTTVIPGGLADPLQGGSSVTFFRPDPHHGWVETGKESFEFVGRRLE